MKRFMIMLIGLFIRFDSHAQTGIDISGKIVDENMRPLPGAVIQLTQPGDSVKKGAATDSKGAFVFKGRIEGNCHLHITFTGYTAIDKDLAVAKERFINLGILQLRPAASMLKEVQVTARRNFMMVENDKKVFYPNMLGGIASGSASDMMQQIPMVDIDKDGNVTLRGKSPRVLIDGKPSPYSDISTALQMIAATAIEKVEVMTNPSAKYDAEGQGGILNIVLKKDKTNGFNGVVNLDAGSYRDNHIGTDFNYRKKQLNFFGNINYHDKQLKGTQVNIQHFTQRDSAAYVNQQRHINTRHKDVDSRLGLDYFINDKSVITLTQGISNRSSDDHTSIAIDSGASLQILHPGSTGMNQTRSTDVAYHTTLNYTQHFARDGDVFTADVIRNYNSITSNMALDNPALFMANQLQRIVGQSNVKDWVLQTDYSGMVGKTGKVETGYKGSITGNQNHVDAMLYHSADDDYHYSEALSSKFKYTAHIQALYATYADSLFSLNYKVGLRTELSKLDGNSYLQGVAFKKSFFNLFPSLFLSKDLARNQSISLGYASRISRPSFLQLLPYVNMSNPLSWQSGNLNLSPAYTRNIEFNYSKLFPESNNFLNISLYYTHTSNSIEMVTTNQPAGYTLTTPQNIAKDQAFGSDVIYRFNVKKIVNFTTTFDVSYNKLSGIAMYTNSLNGFWNYRLHLEGSINLPNRFIFLAHGELTGPQILPQGNMNENKGIDVELKRQFLNKKMTASAIVSDIFYDRKNTTHLNTPDFIEDDVYRENSRMLHVHLSYSF